MLFIAGIWKTLGGLPTWVWQGLGAVALIGAVAWGYNSHVDGLVGDAVKVEQGLEKDRHDKAEKAAAAQALVDERKAVDDSKAREVKRLEGNQAYEDRIAILERRAAAGGVGMRIPTKLPSVCGGAPAAPGASVGGPEPVPTDDLLPETTAAILDVAAGDRRNVQSYNDLLGEYRALETFCTKP